MPSPFFSYFETVGLIEIIPADVKLVPPPALPERMFGRALALEEVRKLLTGPDK